MRTGMVLAVLVGLGLGQVLGRAQQTLTNGVVAPSSNSPALQDQSSVALRDAAAMGARIKGPANTNSVQINLSKTTKAYVSGPIVTPLKAKSAGEFSRHVLHWFSPFSDEEPNLPPGASVSGPVNTRAWSTIVGWSPGRSAFPTGASHEPPQIRLISVSVESQPKQP